MKKLITLVLLSIVFTTAFSQTVVNFIPNEYNLPVIEVNVNGSNRYFIYDTGASVTLLNRESIEDKLVDFHLGTKSVEGVGGDANLYYTGDIDFRIGKHYEYTMVGVRDLNKLCTKLTKAIGNDRKVIGILGMDLIQGLGINIDIVNKRFIIYGEKRSKKAREAVAVDFDKQLLAENH